MAVATSPSCSLPQSGKAPCPGPETAVTDRCACAQTDEDCHEWRARVTRCNDSGSSETQWRAILALLDKIAGWPVLRCHVGRGTRPNSPALVAVPEHVEGVVLERGAKALDAAIAGADQSEHQGPQRAEGVAAEARRGDDREQRQPEDPERPQAPAGRPLLRRPRRAARDAFVRRPLPRHRRGPGAVLCHPLTEPAVRPRTKYRCRARKTMIGTVIVMMPPAVTRFQPWPCWPRRLFTTATVSGAFSPGPMKTRATSRSFHTQRNWKMANDAITGVDIGRINR